MAAIGTLNFMTTFTRHVVCTCISIIINPLTDKRFLASSKLKAFADDNFNMAQIVQFFFEKVENVVGKGENAGYQHFLLFPQCLLLAFFPRVVKKHHCAVKN